MARRGGGKRGRERDEYGGRGGKGSRRERKESRVEQSRAESQKGARRRFPSHLSHCAGQSLSCVRPAEAKVAYLCYSSLVEEDILQGDVAVDDAVPVGCDRMGWDGMEWDRI